MAVQENMVEGKLKLCVDTLDMTFVWHLLLIQRSFVMMMSNNKKGKMIDFDFLIEKLMKDMVYK